MVFSQRKRGLIAVVAAMTAVYLFCAFYHFPGSVVTPSHYSDIGYIWSRNQERGVGPHEFPYLDYDLEYPPIIGLIVWAASSFGSLVHYHYTTAALLYPFALMTVISLYLICRAKKIDTSRIFVWCILTLSMIWFVYYSWDIVAIGFMMAAIYFRTIKRTKTSSLLLGLGGAAKILPIFLLPVFMLEEKKWSKRFLVAGIALGVILAFNIPFMIGNFDGWLRTYTHTATYYNEDSFWLYIFGPSEAFFSRIGSALLFLFFIVLVLTRKMGFLHKCLAMMAAFLASTYMFPPQFSLFLLPLLALVPAISLPTFYIFDLANVSIIIFWFNQANPLDPASPVQWMASFRQLLLMFLLIRFLFPNLLRRRASFRTVLQARMQKLKGVFIRGDKVVRLVDPSRWRHRGKNVPSRLAIPSSRSIESARVQINGCVRNTPDGAVEAAFERGEEAPKGMAEWCKKGGKWTQGLTGRCKGRKV